MNLRSALRWSGGGGGGGGERKLNLEREKPAARSDERARSNIYLPVYIYIFNYNFIYSLYIYINRKIYTIGDKLLQNPHIISPLIAEQTAQHCRLSLMTYYVTIHANYGLYTDTHIHSHTST